MAALSEEQLLLRGRLVSDVHPWEQLMRWPEIVTDRRVTGNIADKVVRSIGIIADISPVWNMARTTYRPHWRLVLQFADLSQDPVELKPVPNPVDSTVISFAISMKTGIHPFAAIDGAVTTESLTILTQESTQPPQLGQYPTVAEITRLLIFQGFHRLPKQAEPWHDDFHWVHQFVLLLIQRGWLRSGLDVHARSLRRALPNALQGDVLQEREPDL
ncbi:hypothetical protein CALVIDRAFT_530142 [Calocera viscosa TUFC12733]|uniref:Uncharacterized protein n=1 Tax=Calocera viscosa (strain TUFC12733) TaxID=1330018 RepID=A0A167ICA0_CALVF|nr:hypothetical protein CALVIDRAFT_530142 [Calocera viscosa TUFC12733]